VRRVSDGDGEGVQVGEQPGGAAAEGVPCEEQGSESSRRGDETVLWERTGTLTRAFDLLTALPADLRLAGRKKDKPQKRKGP